MFLLLKIVNAFRAKLRECSVSALAMEFKHNYTIAQVSRMDRTNFIHSTVCLLQRPTSETHFSRDE